MDIVSAAVVNDLLSGAGQHRGQVQGQNFGMKILENAQGRLATPILDFNAALEPLLAFFLRPAQMIQLGKRLGWNVHGVEQRGHQHLDLTRGQRDADQTHPDRGRRQATGPAVRLDLGMSLKRHHGVVPPGGQEVPDDRPAVERHAGAPAQLACLQGREQPDAG